MINLFNFHHRLVLRRRQRRRQRFARVFFLFRAFRAPYKRLWWKLWLFTISKSEIINSNKRISISCPVRVLTKCEEAFGKTWTLRAEASRIWRSILAENHNKVESLSSPLAVSVITLLGRDSLSPLSQAFWLCLVAYCFVSFKWRALNSQATASTQFSFKNGRRKRGEWPREEESWRRASNRGRNWTIKTIKCMQI